jgi:hypothetical protein
MFIINKNYITMIIHEKHMDKMKRMKKKRLNAETCKQMHICKISAARSDPCLI